MSGYMPLNTEWCLDPALEELRSSFNLGQHEILSATGLLIDTGKGECGHRVWL
jgi:hypothetical protein